MYNSKVLILVCLLILSTGPIGVAQNNDKPLLEKFESKDWVNLLDKDLSHWEVWTGVPEPTVKNLPPEYNTGGEGENKRPIGLGDPMGIYKVTTDENGDQMLNISGEVYAGLTSKKSYANYHLTMLFKWGEKKYEPRLQRKRDCGILYHCYGAHGAFWNVWKRCLEYQIQEGDFGDLYNLAGTSSDVTVDENGIWKPHSTMIKKKNSKKSMDYESPHGKWTRVDLFVIEDKAIHVTNGKVVLALTNATSHDGKKLSSGQIQLQSEAAECYMKDIHFRPISEFPEKLMKEAGLIK